MALSFSELILVTLSAGWYQVMRCDHGSTVKLHTSNLRLLPSSLLGALALECTLTDIRLNTQTLSLTHAHTHIPYFSHALIHIRYVSIHKIHTQTSDGNDVLDIRV